MIYRIAIERHGRRLHRWARYVGDLGAGLHLVETFNGRAETMGRMVLREGELLYRLAAYRDRQSGLLAAGG